MRLSDSCIGSRPKAWRRVHRAHVSTKFEQILARWARIPAGTCTRCMVQPQPDGMFVVTCTPCTRATWRDAGSQLVPVGDHGLEHPLKGGQVIGREAIQEVLGDAA